MRAQRGREVVAQVLEAALVEQSGDARERRAGPPRVLEDLAASRRALALQIVIAGYGVLRTV